MKMSFMCAHMLECQGGPSGGRSRSRNDCKCVVAVLYNILLPLGDILI